MYPKQVANNTAQVLQNYLTYQAVKTIIEQLTETNPAQAIWLTHFSDGKKLQNGETYLESLMDENKELVLRILTVRQDLAEQVLEFIPEMVKVGIDKSNIEHRRHLLERLTKCQFSASESNLPELDQEVDNSDKLE